MINPILGICHLLTIEETIESIVHLSNQIDHSLQLNNEDFIQSNSIDVSREFK